MPRRELDAEHRQHPIERAVLERQRLGIALDPVDGHLALLGAAAGGVEQLGREVEADDLRAGGRGRDRDVAGAGGNVQHVKARAQVHVDQQVARRRLVDQFCHGRVVPGGPGCAVHALEVCNSGHLVGSPVVAGGDAASLRAPAWRNPARTLSDVLLAGRPRFTVRPMGARIRLCGRLEVELGGERVEGRLPGRQGPLVLALLVVNRERPVSRDELIDALWPASPPSDPDEALSALLSKVRQAVGREILTGRRDLTLTLPEDAEVDLELALAASERAQAAIADGDVATAWEAAETALEVSGRGFLVGLDAPWVEDRRRELEELRLRALEAAAESGVALGGARLARAEPAARELVRLAPLREAGHRLLMETLAARGEPGEALAAYEQLRVILRDELGTTPGAAVRTLHERLLAGEERRRPRGADRRRAAGAAPGAPGP